MSTDTISYAGATTENYSDSYTYDLMGRLLKGTTYTYDDRGNRTDTGLTYNKEDQINSVHGYTYNANGDLTDSPGKTYDYDSFGNLIGMTIGSVNITYGLDPHGRQISRAKDGVIVERYLYSDQLNPVAIIDDTGAPKKIFIYGTMGNVPDYMLHKKDDGSWERFYFVTDYKGSVVALLDDAGVTRQEYRYDSWGNISDLLENEDGSVQSEHNLQPFRYNGALWDIDAGLYHFGARDYDPELGVWIQKEPLGLKGALNFYSYCSGDPVNFWDLDGLKAEKVKIPRPVAKSKEEYNMIKGDLEFIENQGGTPSKIIKFLRCSGNDYKVKTNTPEVEGRNGLYQNEFFTAHYRSKGQTVKERRSSLIHELLHAFQHLVYGGTVCSTHRGFPAFNGYIGDKVGSPGSGSRYPYPNGRFPYEVQARAIERVLNGTRVGNWGLYGGRYYPGAVADAMYNNLQKALKGCKCEKNKLKSKMADNLCEIYMNTIGEFPSGNKLSYPRD